MARTALACLLFLSLLVACSSTPAPVTGPTGDDTTAPPPPVPPPMPPDDTADDAAYHYPDAPRQDIVDEIHGQKVADPYRWLEDPADPAVQKWLDANDAMTHQLLDALPYRAELAARFKELLYLDTISAPAKLGKRYFYTRRHKDQEKAIVYWKQGANGEEQVLLDPNAMSDDGHISLGGWYPSWDGKRVAYKLKENNADESTMYIRDVATGEDSKIDVLPGLKYSGASWTPKGDAFYYTYLPSGPDISVDERPGYAELRMHKLGTDPAEDPVVFPATGSAQTFLGGSVSRDGHWLVVYVSHGWTATDVYFRDLRKKGPSATMEPPLIDAEAPVRERVRQQAEALGFEVLAYGADATFDVRPWKDSFYVLTNDGAPKYRVYKVNPRKPARSKWTEIVPEGDTPIESANVVGGHLVLHYLRNAVTEIEIRTLAGKPFRTVELPGLGSAGLGGEPDDDEAYFTFTSFTEPTKIFKTSIKKGKPELWAEIEIPVDTSDIEVEQVWYESKDGTKVPMFVVHKAGMERDGSNPTLLYGYGGFNVNMTPFFSGVAVAWLERGGMFALPNLRGGGEFGEDWHRAGMLLEKQNVFDDFIGAAEYLIDQGYTSSDKLAIWGASNGGLLVGAAMTQRPDLYGAVVCGVPLLDMVRYHMFGSGKTWVPEYGSADDPDQFEVLFGYSPYHRVKKDVRYPAMLMMAAANDDRVDPMHARKFTAAVQWATAGDDPVLIRVERNAGHGGADLVKQKVDSFADQFAFLMWQLGVK